MSEIFEFEVVDDITLPSNLRSSTFISVTTELAPIAKASILPPSISALFISPVFITGEVRVLFVRVCAAVVATRSPVVVGRVRVAAAPTVSGATTEIALSLPAESYISIRPAFPVPVRTSIFPSETVTPPVLPSPLMTVCFPTITFSAPLLVSNLRKEFAHSVKFTEVAELSIIFISVA